MRTIRIDSKDFEVPENCYHVAIDFDGKVYAYEKQPIRGNNITGCWVSASHWEQPGIVIGDLDRIVTDWKDSLYSFMQVEHSVSLD